MRSTLTMGLLVLAVIAAVWFFPILIQPRFIANQKPQLDSRNPTTIDLKVRGEQVATLTNTDALVSLLRAGQHVHSHRCTFQGTLSFHYLDGPDFSVYLLPGHTNANYEFVCTNGYYSVPRVAFMSSLALAGVDTNKIPTE